MGKMTKATLFFLVLLFAFIPTFNYAQSQGNATAYHEQVDKIESLLKAIDYYYVDTVNNENIVENAIVGMLEELDPHSVYIPEDEIKKMNEPLVGNFEGIGIRFNILHDTIIVVSPISGGPSKKLGIRSGDKIIEIENSTVAGIGIRNSDVMEKLRGKKGTKVTIRISRKGVAELIDYTIIRDKIPIYSVDASYMATPTIGYIKVNRFARKTNIEFAEKLTALQEEGMEHLILDLRGNGGGYLETAFKMADEFLDENKLLVFTKGSKHRKQEFHASSKGGFLEGKLVILVDEGSASASEIVAGAIQDWDRGMIIGRKSFGKGLVQKPYYLSDGSAIRLTTARYYTPSGRCIQKPYDKGKKDYYNEISHRNDNGELYLADSIKFPDSLQFKTSSDRIVYGGGGIMPDIFVPLDTQEYSDYYSSLIRKGLFTEFILTHLENNRAIYKANYDQFKKFQSDFNTDEVLFTKFINYCADQGVEKNEEQSEVSRNLIDLHLKALLAQNLWSSSEYFEIINSGSKAYNKAIDSIEGDAFEKSGLTYK